MTQKHKKFRAKMAETHDVSGLVLDEEWRVVFKAGEYGHCTISELQTIDVRIGKDGEVTQHAGRYEVMPESTENKEIWMRDADNSDNLPCVLSVFKIK